MDVCQAVATSLEALSNIQSDEVKYAFYFKLNFIPVENGWQSYTLESEFYKLFGKNDNNNNEWRISNVNKDYKVAYTLFYFYFYIVLFLIIIYDSIVLFNILRESDCTKDN